MISKRVNLFLISTLVCLLTVGCNNPGVITDASFPETMSSAIVNICDVSFEGVEELRAISHDKIEVYFRPATGDFDTNKISYRIYSSQVDTVAFKPEQMIIDNLGRFRAVVQGLNVGSNVVFRVELFDPDKDCESSSGKSLEARTFSNLVAEFQGIQDVLQVPGIDGTNSLEVCWTNAQEYPSILGDGRNPVLYNIHVATDQLRTRIDTPADNTFHIVKSVLHNSLVNCAIVTGLQSNTLYEIAVRAVHDNSVSDDESRLYSEQNLKILKGQTFANTPPSLAEPSSYYMEDLGGINALTSKRMRYGNISGILDHFRACYHIKDGANTFNNLSCRGAASTCEIKPQSDMLANGTTSCKKVNFLDTSTLLTDLVPSTTYLFKLVACVDFNCSSYVENPVLESSTVLSDFSYLGLLGVEDALSINDIGSVFLDLATPSDQGGYFSNLEFLVTTEQSKLEFCLVNNTSCVEPNVYSMDNQNPSVIIDPSTSAQMTLIDIYDIGDTSMQIDGVTYDNRPYCFALRPYVLSSNGTTRIYMDGGNIYSLNWICHTAQLNCPTKTQFGGLTDAFVDSVLASLGVYNITLKFSPPLGGVYFNYEAFVCDKAAFGDSFDLEMAIQDITDNTGNCFVESFLPYTSSGDLLTQYSVLNLAHGKTYYVGQLSVASLEGSSCYSEINPNIYQCHIENGINPTGCE